MDRQSNISMNDVKAAQLDLCKSPERTAIVHAPTAPAAAAIPQVSLLHQPASRDDTGSSVVFTVSPVMSIRSDGSAGESARNELFIDKQPRVLFLLESKKETYSLPLFSLFSLLSLFSFSIYVCMPLLFALSPLLTHSLSLFSFRLARYVLSRVRPRRSALSDSTKLCQRHCLSQQVQTRRTETALSAARRRSSPTTGNKETR
jgi:hypothetical protein